RGLKRKRGIPHTVLLRAASAPDDIDSSVEGWLVSPVAAIDLISMIGDLCGLNKQVLFDKFSKLKLKEIEHEKARILKLGDHQGQSFELVNRPGTNSLTPLSEPVFDKPKDFGGADVFTLTEPEMMPSTDSDGKPITPPTEIASDAGFSDLARSSISASE